MTTIEGGRDIGDRDPRQPSDPRAALAVFLGELEELLEWVVAQRHLLVPKHLDKLLLDAWRELQSSSFRLAKTMLMESSEEELKERGLTGAQLRLKLEAFHWELDALNRTRLEVERGGYLQRLGRLLTGGLRPTGASL